MIVMKKREDNYQLIGDKIYNFRKERGLSQEEFANRIGVSRQIVSKWESNQSVPLVDKLKRISEEFDISYEEIMKGTEYQEGIKKKEILRYVIVFLMLIVLEVIIILIYSYIANHNDYREYRCLGT